MMCKVDIEVNPFDDFLVQESAVCSGHVLRFGHTEQQGTHVVLLDQ